MDINLSLDANLMKLNSLCATNVLNLTLNQVLIAKVLDTQIIPNTIALSINDKNVLVQPQPALNLPAGQSLQLQVVKLLPSPEFKVISAETNQAEPQNGANASSTQILKLLSQSPNLTTAEPSSNRNLANLLLNQLATGQKLQATLLEISNGKVSLEVYFSAPTSAQNATNSLAGNTMGTNKATLTGAQQPPLTSTLVSPEKITSKITNPIIILDCKQLVLAEPKSGASSQSNVSTMLSQLSPGSQMTLQVLKTGAAPVFSLSIQEMPTALNEHGINQLLKQLLPTQASPTVLLNQLQQNLPILENFPSIAETLKQLAHEILAAIPPQVQLSEPVQVKQSVVQSGIFLEAKLAEMLSNQGSSSLQEDTKVKLVKFVTLLKQEIATQSQQNTDKQSNELLNDLLQKTESALAKLTLDQIVSLPKEESLKQSWSLEIPFFFQHQAYSVQIEIEQDKPGAKQNNYEHAPKNWAVSITLSPPELGTIYCKITYYDGAVNTRFWSETPATLVSITDHLDYLKTQFEQKGLKTGFMEAQQGKPTATHIVKRPLASLLNEKV